MRPCGCHAGHEARARGARRRGGAAVRGVDGEENRRVERSGDGSEQGGGDGGEQGGIDCNGDGGEQSVVERSGDGGGQGGEDGGEQVVVEHRCRGASMAADCESPAGCHGESPTGRRCPSECSRRTFEPGGAHAFAGACVTLAWQRRARARCAHLHELHWKPLRLRLREPAQRSSAVDRKHAGHIPAPLQAVASSERGGHAGHIPAPLQADGLPGSKMRKMRRPWGGRYFSGWALMGVNIHGYFHLRGVLTAQRSRAAFGKVESRY